MFGFVKRWVLRREVKRFFERLEKEGHLSFLKAFLGGSKKATAVLAAILAVVFRDLLGLDEATAAELVKLIMAYVVGQGVADLGLAIAGAKKR